MIPSNILNNHEVIFLLDNAKDFIMEYFSVEDAEKWLAIAQKIGNYDTSEIEEMLRIKKGGAE